MMEKRRKENKRREEFNRIINLIQPIQFDSIHLIQFSTSDCAALYLLLTMYLNVFKSIILINSRVQFSPLTMYLNILNSNLLLLCSTFCI